MAKITTGSKAKRTGKARSNDLPDVPAADVRAILVSDIHLSHKPPIARSAEPDWYAAQARPLRQLRELQSVIEIAAGGTIPIICSGDVFDRWNSPPELINFAMAHLPGMYAVPGQHDLPNHDLKQIRRSAYWTLVEAGEIKNLEHCEVRERTNGVVIVGMPWGCSVPVIKDTRRQHAEEIIVLAAHRYVWHASACYEGAPAEQHVTKLATELAGYDVASFGDNHKTFKLSITTEPGTGPTRIVNLGSFMRRNIDQIKHEPTVGLVMADKTVRMHKLDCSEDLFISVESEAAVASLTGLADFSRHLAALGSQVTNFADSVERWMAKNNTPDEVVQAVRRAMEDESGLLG